MLAAGVPHGWRSMVPLKDTLTLYQPTGVAGIGPRAPTPLASVVTLLTNPLPSANPAVPVPTNVIVRPASGVEPAFSVAETPLGSPGIPGDPRVSVSDVPSGLMVMSAVSSLREVVSSPAKDAAICCVPGVARSCNVVDATPEPFVVP